MSVRIISFKKNGKPHKNPYLSIDYFEWINERIKVNGITERAEIYDWLKNSKGEAYIIDDAGHKYNLIPVISADGNKYVVTETDNEARDVLFLLPEII
jgi:hypothetical protein